MNTEDARTQPKAYRRESVLSDRFLNGFLKPDANTFEITATNSTYRTLTTVQNPDQVRKAP